MAEETELAKATVTSGKTSLTMEQLVGIQPGMAVYMLRIGERFWRCYHAGKAQNRLLARYELSEGSKLLQQTLITRPQYTDDMLVFLDKDIPKIRACIDNEDWDHWDEAFADLTAAVNHYHEVTNHGYLQWKVDEVAPRDIVLSPKED